jgi:hypothetical protein
MMKRDTLSLSLLDPHFLFLWGHPVPNRLRVVAIHHIVMVLVSTQVMHAWEYKLEYP